MPFTLAHPVAVLPFRRTLLPFAALVVGSVAPDLLYFVWPFAHLRWGHTLPGLFGWSLPAGVFALWFFDRHLKAPLLDLAPQSLRQRVSPEPDRSLFAGWRSWLVVMVSVLSGALTHIVWDALTREEGWWRPLSAGVAQYDPSWIHARIDLFLTALQSLAGMLLLYWVYRRWLAAAPIRTNSSNAPSRRQMLAVSACLVAAVVIGVVFGVAGWDLGKREVLGRTLAMTISVMICEVIAYTLWWKTHPQPGM